MAAGALTHLGIKKKSFGFFETIAVNIGKWIIPEGDLVN
jgi:hypothetical protein